MGLFENRFRGTNGFHELRMLWQHCGREACRRVNTETRFYSLRMPTQDYLLSREASVQGLILRCQLTSAQWDDFTAAAAKAFENKFGDWVEYNRDVHFGIGIKR